MNTKKGRNAPLETVCDALEGITIEDNPQKIKTTSFINIRRKCYKIVGHWLLFLNQKGGQRWSSRSYARRLIRTRGPWAKLLT